MSEKGYDISNLRTPKLSNKHGLNPDAVATIQEKLKEINRVGPEGAPEIPVVAAAEKSYQTDQALKKELEDTKKELEKVNKIVEGLKRKQKINKLTGLPNEEALAEFVDIFDARPNGVIATYIDLKNFGEINRKVGHNAADQKICDFSTFLKANIRKSDFLFHPHGDEFVLLSIIRRDPNAEITPEEGLKHHLDSINEASEVKFNFNFDFNSVTFDKNKHKSLRDAVNEADKILMAKKDAAREAKKISPKTPLPQSL